MRSIEVPPRFLHSDNSTCAEARSCFWRQKGGLRPLSSNRSFIRDYEAEFGTSFDGVVSHANALGNSATEPDYAAILSLLGKSGAKSLDQELAPARAKLIDAIRAQDPTIPDSVSSISACDIYIARGLPGQYRSSADTVVASNSIDSTLWDASGSPALLIGGATRDELRGGSGNDILLGGDGDDELDDRGGNDFLQGGRGRDHRVFSGTFGNDVVSDLDGRGTLDVGADLAIGEFVSDGVYRSADQSTTYTLMGGSNATKYVVISFAGKADTITVKNWSAARSLGVILMDPPKAGIAAYADLHFGYSGPNPGVLSADEPEVIGTEGDEYVFAHEGEHAHGAGGDDTLISWESAALEGGTGDVVAV